MDPAHRPRLCRPQRLLFAPLDGEYTITAELNDNIVLIWLGTDAYSGWTRGNADLESTYPNPPSSTTVTLSAAQWLLIRVVWADGGGPGTFSISITALDGTEHIGPDLTNSPYLVQYSCDGTSPNIRHGIRRLRLRQICVRAIESCWLDVPLLLWVTLQLLWSKPKTEFGLIFKCSDGDNTISLMGKPYKILRIMPNIMDSAFLPLLYNSLFCKSLVVSVLFRGCFFIFLF